MKTEVTIIVPIYNGAKYLTPFMESVLAQDYSGFEMICVDDASNDATYEILQGYAKRDGRIHIYQNDTQKGAAVSRNLGLKMAKLEYIVFLDADDLVERDFLSQLLCTIKEEKTDIAFCDQDCFEGEEYNNVNRPLNERFIQKAYGKKFRLDELDINDAISVPGNPPVYIIRRTFIDKYHLEFQSLPCFNDTYFVEMVKILAGEITHVRETKKLMHARQHNQISRISYNREPMNAYKATLAIKHKLEELNLWGKMQKYYICRVQRILMIAVKGAKKEESKVQFLKFLQREGLRKLGFDEQLLCCDYLTKDKKYICNLFLHGDYQDIETIEPFDVAVRANIDRIGKLFSNWRGKRIVFWGIGYRWERLYQWCYHEMQFKFFLADTYKAGHIWKNIEVMDCETAAGQAEVVVVLNDLFLGDIFRQIQSYNEYLPIFSLEKFIMMDMKMEECWS